MLDNLSYSNSSASILILSSVVIIPLFFPINLFPFSNISISVISKLNCSFALIVEIFNKEIIINNKKVFNLFFINF